MLVRLVNVSQEDKLWRCEPQVSFDAFTLHAVGWKLHNISIGNGSRFIMGRDDEGLPLASPVRLVEKGEAAMYVGITLSPYIITYGESVIEEPFIVIEPRKAALKEQRYGHMLRQHCCCCHASC